MALFFFKIVVVSARKYTKQVRKLVLVRLSYKIKNTFNTKKIISNLYLRAQKILWSQS